MAADYSVINTQFNIFIRTDNNLKYVISNMPFDPTGMTFKFIVTYTENNVLQTQDLSEYVSIYPPDSVYNTPNQLLVNVPSSVFVTLGSFLGKYSLYIESPYVLPVDLTPTGETNRFLVMAGSFTLILGTLA